jgi:hypothetical protein
MPGSLTIVGLGPARPEQVTLEAAELLRAAQSDGSRVYGFSNVVETALTIAPDLELKILDDLLAHPRLKPENALHAVAELLLRAAFEHHHNALYLVAGNPMVINDAVWIIRRRCAAEGRRLRIVHGMSFFDLVLDQVHWRGDAGIQLCSAWKVASGEVILSADIPALLYELGEAPPDQQLEMLTALQKRLMARRKKEAKAVLLFCSGPPDYRSESREIVLSKLAEQEVPSLANLWVP